MNRKSTPARKNYTDTIIGTTPSLLWFISSAGRSQSTRCKNSAESIISITGIGTFFIIQAGINGNRLRFGTLHLRASPSLAVWRPINCEESRRFLLQLPTGNGLPRCSDLLKIDNFKHINFLYRISGISDAVSNFEGEGVYLR